MTPDEIQKLQHRQLTSILHDQLVIREVNATGPNTSVIVTDYGEQPYSKVDITNVNKYGLFVVNVEEAYTQNDVINEFMKRYGIPIVIGVDIEECAELNINAGWVTYRISDTSPLYKGDLKIYFITKKTQSAINNVVKALRRLVGSALSIIETAKIDFTDIKLFDGNRFTEEAQERIMTANKGRTASQRELLKNAVNGTITKYSLKGGPTKNTFVVGITGTDGEKYGLIVSTTILSDMPVL